MAERDTRALTVDTLLMPIRKAIPKSELAKYLSGAQTIFELIYAIQGSLVKSVKH
jgi:hypothetical protein